jgi:hypothetical protein
MTLCDGNFVKDHPKARTVLLIPNNSLYEIGQALSKIFNKFETAPVRQVVAFQLWEPLL